MGQKLSQSEGFGFGDLSIQAEAQDGIGKLNGIGPEPMASRKNRGPSSNYY